MLRLTLLLPFCAMAVKARQTTATREGTIADPTGTVIPVVSVRATNRSTNLVREAKTDISGTYTVPFLVAGQWMVTATRRNASETLTLDAGQTARMANRHVDCRNRH